MYTKNFSFFNWYNINAICKNLYYAPRGSWAAATQDTNQWIGVEFDTAFEIRAIQTQSRFNNHQRVKTYEITYSFDGLIWNIYTNDDDDTVNRIIELKTYAKHHDLHSI